MHTCQQRPISVVYFRAGYVPAHLPTEAEWSAREMLELSAAIKCPWVGVQLVNTKKVQQVIATGDIVAKYLPRLDSDAVEFASRVRRVQNVFAGLYSLGDDNLCELTMTIIRVMQLAITENMKSARDAPHNFVMKPQMEGGGANLFGAEMVNALNSMNRQKLSAHILMQRVHPPTAMV